MNINKTLYGRIIGQVKRSNSQEKMMEYLRTFGFYFIESEVLMQLYPDIRLKNNHERYSFMVRKINRKRDDVRLIVGVKLWGKKVDRVVIYLEQNGVTCFESRALIPWKERQDINFKKIRIKVKFPDYLTYDQRKKWRHEHEKVKKNPQYLPSKSYLKIKPDVIFIK